MIHNSLIYISFHPANHNIAHHTGTRTTRSLRRQQPDDGSRGKEMVRFCFMNEAELRQWVGANPGRVNDRDMNGITPLYIPVHRKKSLPLNLWLLDKNGADVNTTTSIGWSALHLASSFDILDVLLDRGADPTLQSQVWYPLMQQVHSGNVNLVAARPSRHQLPKWVWLHRSSSRLRH